jgi:hypothetical protein
MCAAKLFGANAAVGPLVEPRDAAVFWAGGAIAAVGPLVEPRETAVFGAGGAIAAVGPLLEPREAAVFGAGAVAEDSFCIRLSKTSFFMIPALRRRL